MRGLEVEHPGFPRAVLADSRAAAQAATPADVPLPYWTAAAWAAAISLAQIPARAAEWVTGAVQSKYAFLLAVNLCLLVVGCVMDICSAMLVVPIIVPLSLARGIDPIHLGIIFLANMELDS
jgi:TRAP-type C4-dicarboxylate transport system permease large subunit